MDPPSRRSRRSSILKVRQTEIVMEDATVDDEHKQGLKRRVSFHNVKTVQNFGKDDLSLLAGSPFKEKIQETMSSDGILTPGRSLGTPSTPSRGHDLENTEFFDNTMAAFENAFKKGPRQRLNYDAVTTHSVTEMSYTDTTTADLLEPPDTVPSTAGTLTTDNRSPIDMSICDSTLADTGAQYFDSNTTRYSQVDMSLDTAMNCTSQSSNDTMAALEGTCEHGKIQSVKLRPTDLYSTPKILLNTSKSDVSCDETMMALNVKPGQQMSILQHTSEVDFEKTFFTYMDETALAFEDVAPAFPGDSEVEAEIIISKNSSDMDITTACSTVPNTEHESNRLSSLIISPALSTSHGNECANATYVVEEDLTTQFQDSLMLRNAVLEKDSVKPSEEVKMIGFENVCHFNPESSVAEVTNVKSQPFHAAGDCDFIQETLVESAASATHVTKSNQNANTDLACSLVPPVLSNSLREATTLSSTLNSTFLKTHLESPCAVDRKRLRISDNYEILGEDMEEQRKEDASCYHNVYPAIADELLESKLVINDIKEQPEVGNVQENLTITKVESITANGEHIDITQTSVNCCIVSDDHGLDGNSQMYDTMRTLAELAEDGEVSTGQNLTTANGTIHDSTSESTSSKRDISLLQVGSRFRSSSSLKDETVLSVRSTREDTASLSCRMMFGTHSVQINYVIPEEDEPDSNLIREQVAEKLMQKINEIQQTSESRFEEVITQLQELDSVKASAVKNMSTRALNFDDEELMLMARLRAESEWMNTRIDVAGQARVAIEQCVSANEPYIKQLTEDAQLCGCLDELQTVVQKLEEEYGGAPSLEKAVEIFNLSEKSSKEEEEFDCMMLAKEIEIVNLELQRAKLRNAEIQQRRESLMQQEKMLERNAARIRELKHGITIIRSE